MREELRRQMEEDKKEKEGKVFILLIDLKTMKIFRMYFNTEFERDKFRRRLIYSNKLVELEVDD